MEKKVFVIFLFLILAIFISFPHTCISQTNTFPSTGNAGIGTTSPGALLHLNSSAETRLRFTGSKTGTDADYASIYAINGATGAGIFFRRIGADNSIGIRFYTANAGSEVERVRIDNQGNVGIGTTNPGTRLSLDTSTGNTVISFGRSGNPLGYLGVTQANNYVIGAGNDDLFFRSDSKNIVFSTDWGATASQLYLKNGGNVGIGTTSPGSRLDVKGTLRLSGSSSGYVGFAPPAGAGSTTYTLPASDGTNGQALTTNGSGQLSWADKGSSANSAIRVVSFTLPGIAIAGENKTCSFIVPFNFTITKAYAYARTAPTGAALIFDIVKNGTSIWNTNPGNRLQITSSQNMGIQTNFDTTTFAEYDIIDIDLAQVGSSTAGADITVEIKGTVS